MKQLLPLAALLPLFALHAQDLVVWKGDDLKRFAETLAPKVDGPKGATKQLSKVGDYETLLVQQEENGQAELHQTDTDLLIIESGEATLLTGGEIVGPVTTAPGEIRGGSIQGGKGTTLGAADVVFIPANLPHQVLVAAGKQVTYLVIQRATPKDAISSALPGSGPAEQSAKKATLGIDLGSGFRSCVAGDDSPDGTVAEGHMKVTSSSFLGPSCVWKPESSAEPVTAESTVDKKQARPGVDTGGGYRSCVPGDDSPSGTIVDGYRKVTSSSPFGVSCGWERIK